MLSLWKCNVQNEVDLISAYYYDFRRSCDTEDWSNDAGNTAAHHSFTYSQRKHTFHNFTCIIFDQINAALVSFQKS